MKSARDSSGRTPAYDAFLNPQCLPETLDLAPVRTAILRALSAELAHFQGIALDIGCGQMPYKQLLLNAPSRVTKYVGLDLAQNLYGNPNLSWDGKRIPLLTGSIDCAIATEVFEHCAQPELVMAETIRVLKPGGMLFLTVPFLWPLHCVPDDEYRYTPFSLKRHLENCGFAQIELKALGGWDASLGQMIGLWARRRWMSPRKRALVSTLAAPVVRFLTKCDTTSEGFGENAMITGLSGTAAKPLA